MRHASSISPQPHRAARRAITALLLSLTLISSAPAAGAPAPAAKAAVITTWNQIAVSTITAAGASPTAFNYFAFVHLAMYNAVVGITGEYKLYRWERAGPARRIAGGCRGRGCAPGARYVFWDDRHRRRGPR